MAWVPASWNDPPGLQADIETYGTQVDLVKDAYGGFLVIRNSIIQKLTLQTTTLAVILSTLHNEMKRLIIEALPRAKNTFIQEMDGVQKLNRDFVYCTHSNRCSARCSLYIQSIPHSHHPTQALSWFICSALMKT